MVGHTHSTKCVTLSHADDSSTHGPVRVWLVSKVFIRGGIVVVVTIVITNRGVL